MKYADREAEEYMKWEEEQRAQGKLQNPNNFRKGGGADDRHPKQGARHRDNHRHRNDGHPQEPESLAQVQASTGIKFDQAPPQFTRTKPKTQEVMQQQQPPPDQKDSHHRTITDQSSNKPPGSGEQPAHFNKRHNNR